MAREAEMHPNFTQALANEKIADLLREADQARKADAARPDETEKPPRRRWFAPKLRRPAVA